MNTVRFYSLCTIWLNSCTVPSFPWIVYCNTYLCGYRIMCCFGNQYERLKLVSTILGENMASVFDLSFMNCIFRKVKFALRLSFEFENTYFKYWAEVSEEMGWHFFLLVNWASFLMMVFDKRAGVQGSWRLSERYLLVIVEGKAFYPFNLQQ